MAKSGHWAHTIRDYGPQIAVPVSAVIMTVCALRLKTPSLLNDIWSWTGLVFAVAILLNIVFSLAIIHRTPRISELIEENSRLREELDRRATDYFEKVRGKLASYFDQLGFTHEERISLYSHESRVFTLCGRYSSNPMYDKRSSRMYPHDQGCLGAAWQTGQCVVEELPDPKSDLDNYVGIHTGLWKMPREIVENLTMKSRWFAGFRIDDEKEHRPVAVIIFESAKPKLRKKTLLEDFVKSDTIGDLKEFLNSIEPMKPSYTYARKDGF
jgi:hypothetical protein